MTWRALTYELRAGPEKEANQPSEKGNDGQQDLTIRSLPPFATSENYLSHGSLLPRLLQENPLKADLSENWQPPGSRREAAAALTVAHEWAGRSVFDLSESGSLPPGSEGPGPPKQKTKTGRYIARYAPAGPAATCVLVRARSHVPG